MSNADRERWEKIHASGSHDEAAPRPTLRWLEPARRRDELAIDLACGRGRHVRPLAMLGYRVVAADISRSALDAVSATRLARAALCVQFDADAWPFRDACFDVVVQVDFLDRRLLPLLRAAVKPGGVVLIDTFAGPASDNVTGPRRSDFRLDYEELEQRFADWELVQTIDEPPPHARSAVLARRPLR